MSSGRECELRAQIAEGERRIEESQATAGKAQRKLDRALREGHDSAMPRRLLKESRSLLDDAHLMKTHAEGELNQYLANIDSERAQALVDAAESELDSMLSAFDVTHLRTQEIASAA